MRLSDRYLMGSIFFENHLSSFRSTHRPVYVYVDQETAYWIDLILGRESLMLPRFRFFNVRDFRFFVLFSRQNFSLRAKI